MQSMAVPPVNWQSQVNDPLEKARAQVALVPPCAGSVMFDRPLLSSVLVMKPLFGVQLHASEHAFSVTVQCVLLTHFVHCALELAVSRSTL